MTAGFRIQIGQTESGRFLVRCYVVVAPVGGRPERLKIVDENEYASEEEAWRAVGELASQRVARIANATAQASPQ